MLHDAAFKILFSRSSIIIQSNRPGCFAVRSEGIWSFMHVVQFKVIKGTNAGEHPVDSDVFRTMISQVMHAFTAGIWKIYEVDVQVFQNVIASWVIEFNATETGASDKILVRIDHIETDLG